MDEKIWADIVKVAKFINSCLGIGSSVTLCLWSMGINIPLCGDFSKKPAPKSN